MHQSDLFLREAVELPGRDFLTFASQGSPLFVLPCGRRKAGGPVPARDLYVSPRFRALRRLAEEFSAPYVIASGKHGIIAPETIVSPYDEDLNLWPPELQIEWAHKVLNQLNERGGRSLILLSDSYAAALIKANSVRSAPLQLHAPLLHQTSSATDEWIQQCIAIATRVRDLRALYSRIDLARQRGETFPLGELATQKLPDRGVYIFLDATEPSAWAQGPRIVRIGTHGVSRGSKASLRNRLRNHLGPSHGVGSHRGSIFRLHVGRAMLESDGRSGSEVPTWGFGQQPPKPVPEAEIVHERRVTDYLRQLEVFVFDIGDTPSKSSLRALAEMQLIGLMTAGGLPLESPTGGWLGNYSPLPAIRTTGLWNVRGVGGLYRPERRGSVSDLLK